MHILFFFQLLFVYIAFEGRNYFLGSAFSLYTEWTNEVFVLNLDSIYTERFMGQPSEDDNFIGYEVRQIQHYVPYSFIEAILMQGFLVF